MVLPSWCNKLCKNNEENLLIFAGKEGRKASDEIAHVLDYTDSKLSDLIGETVKIDPL